MSEDAPVNTGAVEWPHPDTACFMVRSMQAKMHCWAAEDPRRRFGDLFNLVYDPAFLVHAWEGTGSPGSCSAAMVRPLRRSVMITAPAAARAAREVR
jgi:hypothetical protein